MKKLTRCDLITQRMAVLIVVLYEEDAVFKAYCSIPTDFEYPVRINFHVDFDLYYEDESFLVAADVLIRSRYYLEDFINIFLPIVLESQLPVGRVCIDIKYHFVLNPERKLQLSLPSHESYVQTLFARFSKTISDLRHSDWYEAYPQFAHVATSMLYRLQTDASAFDVTMPFSPDVMKEFAKFVERALPICENLAIPLESEIYEHHVMHPPLGSSAYSHHDVRLPNDFADDHTTKIVVDLIVVITEIRKRRKKDFTENTFF